MMEPFKHKAWFILPANLIGTRMLTSQIRNKIRSCAQLSCEHRSASSVVTSNSRQLRTAFAFAGSLKRA